MKHVYFLVHFLLDFFAFLRVGEMTVASIKIGPSEGNHAIKFENIDITDLDIRIYLASSKSDQLKKGVSIVVNKQANDHVCPVKLLRKYLKNRSPLSELLFCHFDGSPVTRYQFSRVLKKLFAILALINQFTEHIPFVLEGQRLQQCLVIRRNKLKKWDVRNQMLSRVTLESPSFEFLICNFQYYLFK